MSLTRRVDEARDAFRRGDRAAAARAHEAQRIQRAAEEHGGAGSQYMGDFVYGGLDGIITTFAVVSGVAGASLGANVILIMGLANLFADGFSMATGAYLSAKSEREYYARERQREAWEVDQFPDGERQELLEIYQHSGYTPDEARALVDIQTRRKEQWVDAMMVHELGLLPDANDPLYSALATFIAFAIAGSVPLLVYLLGTVAPIDPKFRFPIAIGMTALALFALGSAKVFVTARNWFRSGLETMLVGGLASAVAYLVGYLLRGVGA